MVFFFYFNMPVGDGFQHRGETELRTFCDTKLVKKFLQDQKNYSCKIFQIFVSNDVQLEESMSSSTTTGKRMYSQWITQQPRKLLIKKVEL